VKQPEECFYLKDTASVSWINIDGVHDTKTIASIGEHYALHPLVIEDIVNTNHRPKAEEFDQYVFCTLKMLGISEDATSIVSEHVSFVLGKSWLLSFQEQEGDIYDKIRNRIESNIGSIRKQGADYLLYRLIDTVVDNYFFVSEYFNEHTEKLEEQVLVDPDIHVLKEIQRLKKLLMSFRKASNPLREAALVLQRNDGDFFQDTTIRYLKDVHEHLVQVSDGIDSHRDILANIMDLYLSGVSSKMNRTMQVLTIIATLFIPLTFIAGVYGMNFEHMPELHWQYGYHAVWVIMLVVAVFMLLFFKRKKWL
jgi:magnesium transporter